MKFIGKTMILHKVQVNLDSCEFFFKIEVNTKGHYPRYYYIDTNLTTSVQSVDQFSQYCYQYVAQLEEQIRDYNAEGNEQIELISNELAIADFQSQILELKKLVEAVGYPMPNLEDAPIPF